MRQANIIFENCLKDCSEKAQAGAHPAEADAAKNRVDIGSQADSPLRPAAPAAKHKFKTARAR